MRNVVLVRLTIEAARTQRTMGPTSKSTKFFDRHAAAMGILLLMAASAADGQTGCIPGTVDPGPMDCHTNLVSDPTNDPNILGNRTPVILIHGIWGNQQSNGTDSAFSPNPDYFRHLIDNLSSRADFEAQYKLYRFHYESDVASVGSVWEIGRSLRNWIDAYTRSNPGWNRQIVIIAHSMGGLVARSYMNEHDTDYGAGFVGLRGGVRVSKLITLATPHHGTPSANDVPRTNGQISAAGWLSLMRGADIAMWGFFTATDKPNRSDLRWDNFDGLWSDVPDLYSDNNPVYHEPNDWLIGMPHTYDYKITAFYGVLGTDPLILDFSTYGAGDFAQAGLLWGSNLSDPLKLELAAVLMQRIMTYNFDSSNAVTYVNNDGIVPAPSAMFAGGGVVRIGCLGANHYDMKDGTIAYVANGVLSNLCDNGLPLFPGIAVQLGLPSSPVSPAVIAISPDSSWNFGNVTVSNSSSKNLILSNNGGSTLTINSLGLSGTNAGDFSITNAPSTPFTIAANSSQTITIRFRPSSSGGRSATLTVNSNASNASSKTISLAGTGVAVSSCTYSLPTSIQSFGSGASNGSLTVNAGSGCGWIATSNYPWLPITSGANGSGTQQVFFSVASNVGTLRVGAISVQGGGQTQTFLVTQDGPTGSCVYSLNPNYQSVGSALFNNAVTLTTSSSCGWSASSNTPWLTLNTTGLHQGSGSLSYTGVANASSAQRTGTITVTGQGSNAVLTVTQAGSSNTCSYSLSPSQSSAVYQGGSTFFGVTAGSGCNWRASASDNWLAIQSGSYGSGNGQVLLNVGQNPTASPRTGFITVQGDTQTVVYTLTQSGQPNVFPSISIPTTSFNLGNALVGGTAYQTVTVQNNGNGPLYVGSIYLLSGTSEFSTPASIPSVPPSGSAFFTIALTPLSVGPKTATFRITSNDPNQPAIDVSVSAIGVPPGSGGIDFLWSSHGVVPETMLEMSSATVAPNIYVFANHSWRYDLTISHWTQLNASGLNPDDAGAAFINGNIYLQSGVDSQLKIYNIASGTWSNGPAMPDTRTGAAVVTVNSKLYVIGGLLNGVPTPMVEQFDPATNQWTSLKNMPTARAFASSAVVNNIIYVIGGQLTGNNPTPATEAFDPAANAWTVREDMPTRRSLTATAVLLNKIEVIGGLGVTDPRTLTTVEEFDPSKPDAFTGQHNAWSIRNPISTARYGATAGTVNNTVYVIGGNNVDTGAVQTIEAGALLASPAIVVPVKSLTFGDVNLNNTGEVDFTVQNNGNALLTLSYTYSGSPVQLDAPASIAAGQAVTLRVRFQPTGLGSQSATITIHSNDPATPVVNVGLTGRGTPAAILPAGQTFTQTATLPLPGTGNPQYLTVNSGKAYVAMSGPPQLGVVDLTTGSASGLVTFSAYPAGGPGQPSVVGTNAYVPLSNLSPNDQLAIVDLTGNSVSQYVPVAVGPYHTAVWNNQVYIQQSACWSDGHADVVQVLNTANNNVIATIPVNQSASGIAIDAQTGRGYVSGGICSGLGSASTLTQVLDANSNTITGTVDTPFGTQAVAISGTRAYFIESGLLDVVDISSNNVLARIPIDRDAHQVAATGSFVFVSSFFSNAVYVISPSLNAVVATLTIPNPVAIAADSSTNTVYVVSGSSRSIAVIQFREPAFDVSCSASLAAAPGNNASTGCNATSQDGYSGTLTLGCAGLPQGATCNFGSPSLGLTSNGSAQTSLTIALPANIVPGIYSVQLTASDGSTTRVANLSLIVQTCSYTLSSTGKDFSAAGGPGSVILGATTDCGWTASSNASWIGIKVGQTGGTGSGSVGYTVAANPDSTPHSGTLTIAGQTFTVTQAGVPNTSVSTLGISPNTGNGNIQTFTAAYSAANGYQDLRWVQMLIAVATNGGGQAYCYVHYDVQGRGFWLYGDGGFFVGPISPGAPSNRLQNALCALNTSGSSATGDGLTLTLNANVVFKGAGARNIYLRAMNMAGVDTGWVQQGTWITAAASLGMTVSPSSGSVTNGTQQTFTLTYPDTPGFVGAASGWEQFLVAVASDGGGQPFCYVHYDRGGNGLWMYSSDVGYFLGPVMPGTASNALNSSACSVNTGSATVQNMGGNLVLSVPVTLKSPMVGTQKLFERALTVLNVDTGLVQTGTLTVN